MDGLLDFSLNVHRLLVKDLGPPTPLPWLRTGILSLLPRALAVSYLEP